MSWGWQLTWGIVSAIAGLIVLANPFSGSIAVTLLAGGFFLVMGILQGIGTFWVDGWGNKLWWLISGIVGAIVGINLLFEPLSGMIVLTIVLGSLFLVSGIWKLIGAFGEANQQFKWGLIISGIASLLVAFIVLTNIPFSATVALGLLLGIQLLSDGLTGVLIALSRRSVKMA